MIQPDTGYFCVQDSVLFFMVNKWSNGYCIMTGIIHIVDNPNLPKLITFNMATCILFVKIAHVSQRRNDSFAQHTKKWCLGQATKVLLCFSASFLKNKLSSIWLNNFYYPAGYQILK